MLNTEDVGSQLKQRWNAAPEAVRQIFQEDLQRICHLLRPDTDIAQWQQHDHNAELMAKVRTEQAYAQLKAECIAEARKQKQQALLARLAQQRAAHAATAAALQADEQQQFAAQTEALQALAGQLHAQVELDMQRYGYTAQHHSVLASNVNANDNIKVNMSTEHNTLLNTAVWSNNPQSAALQQLLQQQSEHLIEQAVTVFRAKLHQIAQAEIARLTAQH